MVIIGVTGSVGMGKSEISKYFKKNKINVFDSDYQISYLYNNKNILNQIKENFPRAFSKNVLSKKSLTEIVFKDKSKLLLLEKILYNKLTKVQAFWIRKNIREKKKIIVIDVPLLFEKDNLNKYDITIVVSCSKETQQRRVLKRKDWNINRLESTLKNQLDDKIKRELSDITINTDRGKRYSLEQVIKIIKYARQIIGRPKNTILKYF